ncbi:MAG: energy transducer TonB [Chryseotalea sp.]|jgi:protein TonB
MIRQLLFAFLLAVTISAFGQSETTEITFTIVEDVATFPGGMTKFYEYLRSNIVYPKDAKKLKVKGTVFVEFYIKEDGYVDKDSVRALPQEFLMQNLPPNYSSEDLKELPQSCKDEAIRVIRNSPKWNPGKRRDVPVKQRMVMPISFGR